MTPTRGTSRRRLAVLLLVCVAVALAGCAGWGTDGPADDPDDSNTSSNDLEDEQNDDSSNADSDGSDTTNESDSTSDEEESDDGPPDGGEDDSSDGDSGDDSSGTDESVSEDTSDGSEDGSEESTDEDTESEPDGADDGEADDESPPADENGDENSSDEDADDENTTDENETYTLAVEAEGPVTIERLSDGATTTREATDGTAEFTVLEDEYNVRAEQEEYVDPLISFGVDEDTTITLQQSGSITYTVVDAETGEPIEGAEISGLCDLWYSGGDAYISGESDEDGVIEAQTLTPTTCRYETQITAEGYEPASLGEINVPEDDGTTVELQPEDSESAAVLALGGVDGTASIVRA